MKLQCKVATFMKQLTALSRIFAILITHLEVDVLFLEETSSRSFQSLSKEAGLRLLESLCSVQLFGNRFRFSSSHKICDSTQLTNTSENLHNGSWTLDMGDIQMRVEISSFQIISIVKKTQSSHLFKQIIQGSRIPIHQMINTLQSVPFWPVAMMMLIQSMPIFSDNFQERTRPSSVPTVSTTIIVKEPNVCSRIL